MTKEQASELIKQKAIDLGFSACGIAKAEAVDADVVGEMERWLSEGNAADMDYLHRNKNMRYDPRELFPGAKSLIVVAMNYFPQEPVATDVEFAYYSYGKDYHFVLKNYLAYIIKYIEEDISQHLGSPFEARAFVDSAPLMEQYWAVKAGVGFRGRNSLVIVPGVGSFCFLGIIVTNIELSYDKPLHISCGKCHNCENACPTGAIGNCRVDARKCISYQTIENKSDFIPDEVATVMGKRIYGCDACQLVCPWNKKFSHPTTFSEFFPSEEFKNLTSARIETLGSNEFKRVFKGSPILRISKKKLLLNKRTVKKLLFG